MMFYPPTIPINIFSFLILCLFWGGVSYWLSKRSDESVREKWLFHGLIGVLSSLASLLLLTAFSFVPDDWSAVRMAVPLSWLYGYPIYSDFVISPGNAYFYMPFGLVCYLPAAFVGWMLNSPNTCLFLSWVTSLILYLIPFIILIKRFKINNDVLLLLISIVFTVSLSIPSLRYVATMAHVDAFGFFCIFSAVAYTFPMFNENKISVKKTCVFSFLIVLSVFTKQTFWPISLLVFSLFWVHYKASGKLLFLLCSCFFSLLLVASILIAGAENFIKFAILAPANAPQVLSLFDSAQRYFEINWPLFLLFLLLSVLLKKSTFKKEFIESKYFWFSLLLLFTVSSLLSIYTYTKLGADSNHFILPSSLVLFANIKIIFSIISKSDKYRISLAITLIFFTISLPETNYLKTYCGWYLWFHSPHQAAFRVTQKYSSDRFYFPWQPLSTLIGYGKMYHIDQSLYYESVNKMTQRTDKNIFDHMPERPFYIPLRPYSADSYLVKKLSAKEVVSDLNIQELAGWKIFKVE